MGIDYNNNQWCSVVYRVLDQRRLYFDTRKKSLETRSEAENINNIIGLDLKT